MRLESERRDPQENFYFDGGELVVAEDAIAQLGSVPSVNYLGGDAILHKYKDLAGHTHNRGLSDISGPLELPNGYQMMSVSTGPGRPVAEFSDEKNEWEYSLEEVAGEYKVQEGDILIAEASSPRVPKRTVAIPADEPLPLEPQDWSYGPLGFMDKSGVLNTWGIGGGEAQYLVDLLIAAKLTDSRIDNANLDRQLGDFVLSGIYSTRNLGRTYIEQYESKYGGNYSTFKEPKQRYSEFLEPLTDEQRELLFGS